MAGWKTQGTVDNGITCSLCQIPTIYIEALARQKIELLMAAYTHQEWLAYLMGKMSDKGNVFVEDISVPPHVYANGASAEAAPPDYDAKTGKYSPHIPANCVGVIHSHNGMGAFHSGIDHDYVDQNYPISITVSNRETQLSYDTTCYAITPCKKVMIGKSQVKYVAQKPLFDTKTWLKKAQDNIDRSKQVKITVVPEHEVIKISSSDHYVPYRYRQQDTGSKLITDSDGVVLTDKELQQMLDMDK